jgi:recombination protein RecR
MSGQPIEDLIRLFSKLPGLGPRSARRIVLHLLRERERLMTPLAEGLTQTMAAVSECNTCGNLDTSNPCTVCTDPRRDTTVICVVEDPGDIWAIERMHLYRGHYHVLGGTLSALDGRGPAELHIEALLTRAAKEEVKEIILATNATLEGQTTAHYLAGRLAACNVSVSRLAQGMPIGGELDYLDEGTLGAAFKARLPCDA